MVWVSAGGSLPGTEDDGGITSDCAPTEATIRKAVINAVTAVNRRRRPGLLTAVHRGRKKGPAPPLVIDPAASALRQTELKRRQSGRFPNQEKAARP